MAHLRGDEDVAAHAGVVPLVLAYLGQQEALGQLGLDSSRDAAAQGRVDTFGTPPSLFRSGRQGRRRHHLVPSAGKMLLPAARSCKRRGALGGGSLTRLRKRLAATASWYCLTDGTSLAPSTCSSASSAASTSPGARTHALSTASACHART